MTTKKASKTKKLHTLSRYYKYLNCYLEDFQEIFERLKEYGGSDASVEIETENYTYSDFESFIEEHQNAQIKKLSIRCHSRAKPYVATYFDASELFYDARLYVGKDTLEGAGIYGQIDQVISNALKKPRWFYSFTSIGTVYTFLAGLIVVSLLEFKLDITLIKNISNLTIPWITFFVLLFLSFATKSRFFIKKRNDHTSFFSRNRDDLIKDAIKIVLTAVVSVAVTLTIAQRNKPSNLSCEELSTVCIKDKNGNEHCLKSKAREWCNSFEQDQRARSKLKP